MSRWSQLLGSSTVRAAWLMLDSTASFRLSTAGSQVGVIDLQHGLMSCATPDAMSAVRDAGAVPMVRLSANNPAGISRALDAGAVGVICPMVNSVDDARELVRAVRFPPEGSRSFGPTYGVPGQPSTPDESNASVLALAMIETPEAMEAAEDIVRVDGIDGLFIGPMDLSLGMGFTSQDTVHQLEQTFLQLLKVAKRHGKHIGIYSATSKDAQLRKQQEFDLIVPVTDIAMLSSGAQAATEILAS